MMSSFHSILYNQEYRSSWGGGGSDSGGGGDRSSNGNRRRSYSGGGGENDRERHRGTRRADNRHSYHEDPRDRDYHSHHEGRRKRGHDDEERGRYGPNDSENNTLRQHDRRSQNEMVRITRKRFPPPFDSSSSDYAFDPQTGYFYEERSDFFYDPKSKLYYDKEQKLYYSHEKKHVSKTDEKSKADPREEDCFQRFDQAEGKIKMRFIGFESSDVGEKGEIMDGVQDLITLPNANQADGKRKNKISINIKQKPKKAVTSGSGLTKKSQKLNQVKNEKHKQSQAQKMRHEDMEKWSQRIKEVTANDENDSAMPAHIAPALGGSEEMLSISSCLPVNERIVKTKSGKLVCILCKRKFASMEKLVHHEALSEFHKYNVLRLIQKEKSVTKEYIDRAHQRRIMYEADQPSINPLLAASKNVLMVAPNLSQARNVQVTETVNPENNLGGSNIGNQILKKLGWEGGSLGKPSNNANGVGDGNDTNGDRDGNARLKEEWERIESMASRSGRRR